MSSGNIVEIIGAVADALKIENDLTMEVLSIVFDCVCLIAWASRMGHVAVRRNTPS